MENILYFNCSVKIWKNPFVELTKPNLEDESMMMLFVHKKENHDGKKKTN